MTVATAVFMAGIGNGLVYTLGYLFLLLIQFVTKGGGGANLGSAVTSLLVTLMFSTLLSCIITVVLALPIALVCRWLGWTGTRAFVIAPAVGAAIACAIASLLDVAPSTYAAIVAVAYISAAIIWLSLGRIRRGQGDRAVLSAA
ncbi:hypothetical protein [Sphingomonas solaris]|uniref:Uncharacterized protein n=1 Tax=Alterirhizorhabdus solaris TaxID=2529389 RepID=A0A558R5V7_9SPHN|nr:hypothetical protein [Sphingomonas solaris]TVV74764.1 hypothetical protein FOY91_08920 [Sphingomonas solaris]